MAYTLIGLLMASTMGGAGTVATILPQGGAGSNPCPSKPSSRCEVHLRADVDCVRLVGRTDALPGAVLQIVVRVDGEGAEPFTLARARYVRTVARLHAGPFGGFEFPLPAAGFGSGSIMGTSMGVIWAGAGGLPGAAWTPLPVQNPASPHPVPPARRAIVVTEFMKNPAAVADTRGEWLEIHNLTSGPLDLDGWTLRDDGTNNTVLVAPGGSGVVAPGGFLVLGRNVDPGLNGGVAVDIGYSGFTLNNGADQIVLEAPGGHEVDRVDYGDGPLWPDDSGRSAMLIPRAWGNDLALLPSAWCSSVSLMPGGDRGTPGAHNDSCGP